MYPPGTSSPGADHPPPTSVTVDDMGVIRKKTAVRGGEGGVKYHCDVCSADITSTVRQSPLPRIATPLPGAF